MVKKAVEFKIDRDGSELTLWLKVSPEIERFFKQMAAGKTKESGKWYGQDDKPLSFYEVSDRYAQFKHWLSGRHYFNDYGDGILEGGGANIAPLRTVGASKGVTLRCGELVSYEGLIDYAHSLGEFTKDLYQNYIRDGGVKATISVEV